MAAEANEADDDGSGKDTLAPVVVLLLSQALGAIPIRTTREDANFALCLFRIVIVIFAAAATVAA